MSAGMKQTEEWEVPALPVLKYQSTVKSYEGAAHGNKAICAANERGPYETHGWRKKTREESLTP